MPLLIPLSGRERVTVSSLISGSTGLRLVTEFSVFWPAAAIPTK